MGIVPYLLKGIAVFVVVRVIHVNGVYVIAVGTMVPLDDPFARCRQGFPGEQSSGGSGCPQVLCDPVQLSDPLVFVTCSSNLGFRRVDEHAMSEVGVRLVEFDDAVAKSIYVVAV
jgi:hypothetical protein